MSRVLTFSRTYPSYHPRAGKPTDFVEKIIRGLMLFDAPGYSTENIKQLRDLGVLDISRLTPNGFKHHTIRAGHRFKPGDFFSPRVWSGKPYKSKMITIGPDIEVKKTWDIRFFAIDEEGRACCELNQILTNPFVIKRIAENDGLNYVEFVNWFTLSPEFKSKKLFDGQIIAWSDQIEY